MNSELLLNTDRKQVENMYKLQLQTPSYYPIAITVENSDGTQGLVALSYDTKTKEMDIIAENASLSGGAETFLTYLKDQLQCWFKDKECN